MEAEPRFKVLEHDNMTGWDRYLDNMAARPWSGTFTWQAAEESVAWREKNITARYSYKIVPLEPYMTDNEAAAKRHQVSHGPWPMEDCGDPDCTEARMRLRAEKFMLEIREEDSANAE